MEPLLYIDLQIVWKFEFMPGEAEINLEERCTSQYLIFM